MRRERSSSGSSDIGPLTIVGQDGGAFVVVGQSARVRLSAVSRCASSKAAYFELALINSAAPGQERIVSRVEMNSKTPEYGAMGVGASLILPVGQYTWIARAIARDGGFLNLSSNVKGIPAVVLPPDQLDAVGSVSCAGTSGGYVSVQVQNPLQALSASVFVHASLDAGEELRAFLAYAEESGNGLETLETRLIGPAGPSVGIEAYMFYLDQATPYSIEFAGFQTGSFESSSTITVRG